MIYFTTVHTLYTKSKKKSNANLISAYSTILETLSECSLTKVISSSLLCWLAAAAHNMCMVVVEVEHGLLLFDI
jgi:hypothetical protein